MNVCELALLLDGKVITNLSFADREIEGMYTCDMLSVAMSGISQDYAWVTIVNNRNIVAVSVLTEASCIVVSEDVQVDDSIIEKANEEQVSIISTRLCSYEVCVRFGKNHEV